ncbi:dioxygenase [Nocardia puris]|uniref:4,5-DOPA dioxygenase extradiol n=1 Tax=Nocardia puris TaxID=208602 RepID=A0A366E3Y9_9NOCA|nr:class III extradiol ring-cleavage dioxygenase [Nocardia puris]MBF6214660.1 dioxygenase [Nocardia puris]MBF6368866.1 dioxygenase [Nocardia puris]MBF6462446.1 dioxygenase [Nocardia puris]RBO97027.1 4,5-DOPA dioxygenase extradiol [Nocardia puris]
MSDRAPVLYLSHGAPPLADHPHWPAELAAWAGELPHPTAILMISAHWEAAPITLGATTTVPLVYDFSGFPRHYYEVVYPAPGAPDLASKVRALLGGQVHDAPGRGLDHGAYVPLKEMYPAADVPVLQMSLPTLDPTELFAIGRTLAPLRDEGVLIVGSGFFTHNLRALTPDDEHVHAFTAEFDDWGARALAEGDLDSLLDFRHRAPAPHLAHPRTEHFAPLFVSLGAGADDLATLRTPVDGYWLGMARRSIQLG